MLRPQIEVPATVGKNLDYDRPYLYPKQLDAIFEPKRYSLIEASTKAGKAQPLDALLYTAAGPIRMGDVQVGQWVLTPSGSARVVAVYPQEGDREVLRVTFSDGAVVEADADHLWEVHQSGGRREVVTTEQVQTWGRDKLRRAWVPHVGVAIFATQPVPVDPYLLGALIGDGGLSGETVKFSNADEEIIEQVRARLPAGHSLRYEANHDWRVTAGAGAAQLREDRTHLRGVLQRLGLGGKGSHEKFVPDAYRYNSEEVRLAVLRGIFDTDGFVDKHGQPGIEQTSERLARDITEIVQSLGGSVLTRLRAVNGYRAKDGRFIQCRPVWRQTVRLPDGSILFGLERKRARCAPKKKPGHRMFRSIEFARRAQTQCIELDDDRQLYLTDGFIPTHNTSGCITWIVEQAFQGRPGFNYWWVAPVSDQALIAFRRTMRAIPQELYTPNISLKTITLFNGAVIWFKSGDKPNSLYGEDVYAAVIDEASRMKEDAYIAIRSTLTFTRGPVRIIGNVRGRKNWFFKLARRAEHGDDEMGYHKIVAADAVSAGVLDAKEIEDARTQMPEQSWRELYQAEPSDDGGNPFGLQHIAGCVVPALSTNPPVWWGWDLAKRQDYTVGIALDKVGYVCRFERFHHIPWPEIMQQIIRASGRLPALVDSTGLGDPIVDQLQRTPGTRFEGYHFNPASKQKLMEGLAVAIQSRAVTFPPGFIVQELEQFEFEYTRTGVRYCLGPQTPVLTSGLRWVEVGSLCVGDGLLAFDEHPEPGQKSRSWRSARVTETSLIQRPCYRVTLDDGTDLIASSEHKWLVDLGQGRAAWKTTEELRAPHPTSESRRFAPHRLIKLLDVWKEPTSYEAGYLAGVFDGEGYLGQASKGHGGHSLRIAFSQKDNQVAAYAREVLTAFGFEWSEHRGTRDVISFGLTGRRHEVLRLLGQIRPKRLLAKFDPSILGTLERKQDVRPVAIEFIGLQPVIALGTTTKTLIAAGLASHNSAPSGYYDDCVCALALAVMCKGITPAAMNITAEMVTQIVRAGAARRRRY